MDGPGITPIREIAGVGQNFQDHPGIRLSFQIKSDSQFPHGNHRHTAVVGRYTSGVPGCGAADMQVISLNFGVKHDAQNNPDDATLDSSGFRSGGVVIWLNECFSTGQVPTLTAEYCYV
eukprot:COSAG05_NODE_364_length_10775_cov_3.222836_2_plen_119_part_00